MKNKIALQLFTEKLEAKGYAIGETTVKDNKMHFDIFSPDDKKILLHSYDLDRIFNTLVWFNYGIEEAVDEVVSMIDAAADTMPPRAQNGSN